MELKARYKVIPCISNKTGGRGWKIVTNDAHEFEYCKGGGITFTIYFNYEDALRDCEHLNGRGRVIRFITQDSWDILRAIIKGEA